VSTQTPLVISMMYCLDTEQGHILGYNKEFGHIVNNLGWQHTAAVRAAARVRELPAHWRRALGSAQTRLGPGPLDAVLKFVALVSTQRRFLAETAASETRPLILFLEWFDAVHMLALVLALLFSSSRKRFALWIMYRLAAGPKLATGILRGLHTCLDALLGRANIRFLSDSDLVARKNAVAFGRAFAVLPIPHTRTPDLAQTARGRALRAQFAPDMLVCWWPGMPAPLKGLDTIKRLTTLRGPAARNTAIVLAEGAGVQSGSGDCRVETLPNALSSDDYWAWMSAAGAILLPYDPSAYADRTSGIFTEAVVAGKLPLVSAGTWMAHELLRHDAPEFIIDWQRPDVLEHIHALAQDQVLRAKLSDLQQRFARFHCESGFGAVLQSVWDTYAPAQATRATGQSA
jgi:hypothetical protein